MIDRTNFFTTAATVHRVAGEHTMTTRESWAMLKALQQINGRVEALTAEVTDLRTTIDIQATQISELQADLGLLLGARRPSGAVHPPAYLHTYRLTGPGRN
jgi:hypothetical protein